MAIKGKDGRDIDLGGVDIKTAGVIEVAIDALEHRLRETLAKIEAAAVAVDPKSIAALAKDLEELKRKPSPSGADTPEKPPADKPLDGDRIAALEKTLAEMRESQKSSAERSDIERRVDQYLAAKLPNLAGGLRADLRERLLAAAPKDDAAFGQEVSAVRERWKSMGIGDEAVKLSANPESENAKKAADEKSAEKERLIKSMGRKEGTFM